MTSSFDAYSCILHAERSLKPYVQASYNCSNFHFCGTSPRSTGRASPACPRRGYWGLCTEPTPSLEQHLGFGLSLLGFKGQMSQLLWTREKTHLLFFRLFSRVLAVPFNPGTIEEGRKMPLNLAIAALSLFLPPTNPAQPLMSHNWFLSAPNHFSEVRLNF